jgi:hypothetical protein
MELNMYMIEYNYVATATATATHPAIRENFAVRTRISTSLPTTSDLVLTIDNVIDDIHDSYHINTRCRVPDNPPHILNRQPAKKERTENNAWVLKSSSFGVATGADHVFVRFPSHRHTVLPATRPSIGSPSLILALLAGIMITKPAPKKNKGQKVDLATFMSETASASYIPFPPITPSS